MMRVIRHLARVPRPLDRAVLTLGNFDGVHLGHQAILRSAVERARADGGQAIVLTFEPHPLTVVAPERAPAVIQPLHDRLATLREFGIDVTVLQRFTRQFAALDPEAFVREFLLRHLALRHLVVGYNVNFGRDRAGSAHTLRELGARLGFGVEVVGPVTVGAEQVSSTALREVLGRGDVREARRLLGRPHSLRGRVVTGDRRGRGACWREMPGSGSGAEPSRGDHEVARDVPPAAAGMRLDRFVASLPGIGTRSQAKQLIDAGRVRVDGIPRKRALALRAGAHVAVSVLPPPRATVEPEPLPLTLLYEDEAVVAIDKPPG